MEQPTIELEYVKFLKENSIKENQLPHEIRQQINILKAAVGLHKKKGTEATKNAVIKQDIAISDLIADFIEGGIEDTDNKEDEAAAILADREAKMKDLKDFISADETIDYKTASDEDFNKLLEKLTNAKAAHEKAQAEKKAAADAEKERLKKEAEEKEGSDQTPATPKTTEEDKGKQTIPPVVETPKQTPPAPPTGIRPEVVAMENKIKEKLVASGNNTISWDDLKAIIGRTPATPYQTVGNTKLQKTILRSEFKLVN